MCNHNPMSFSTPYLYPPHVTRSCMSVVHAPCDLFSALKRCYWRESRRLEWNRSFTKEWASFAIRRSLRHVYTLSARISSIR